MKFLSSLSFIIVMIISFSILVGELVFICALSTHRYAYILTSSDVKLKNIKNILINSILHIYSISSFNYWSNIFMGSIKLRIILIIIGLFISYSTQVSANNINFILGIVLILITLYKFRKIKLNLFNIIFLTVNMVIILTALYLLWYILGLVSSYIIYFAFTMEVPYSLNMEVTDSLNKDSYSPTKHAPPLDDDLANDPIDDPNNINNDPQDNPWDDPWGDPWGDPLDDPMDDPNNYGGDPGHDPNNAESIIWGVPNNPWNGPWGDPWGDPWDHSLDDVDALGIDTAYNLDIDPPGNLDMEPVDYIKPEPVDNIDMEPMDYIKPEPLDDVPVEPLDYIKPEPLDNVDIEPMDYIKPEPLYIKDIEPLDIKDIESLDNKDIEPLNFDHLEFENLHHLEFDAQEYFAFEFDPFNNPELFPTEANSTNNVEDNLSDNMQVDNVFDVYSNLIDEYPVYTGDPNFFEQEEDKNKKKEEEEEEEEEEEIKEEGEDEEEIQEELDHDPDDIYDYRNYPHLNPDIDPNYDPNDIYDYRNYPDPMPHRFNKDTYIWYPEINAYVTVEKDTIYYHETDTYHQGRVREKDLHPPVMPSPHSSDEEDNLEPETLEILENKLEKCDVEMNRITEELKVLEENDREELYWLNNNRIRADLRASDVYYNTPEETALKYAERDRTRKEFREFEESEQTTDWKEDFVWWTVEKEITERKINDLKNKPE